MKKIIKFNLRKNIDIEPTPVLPGKPHGQGSLTGYRP